MILIFKLSQQKKGGDMVEMAESLSPYYGLRALGTFLRACYKAGTKVYYVDDMFPRGDRRVEECGKVFHISMNQRGFSRFGIGGSITSVNPDAKFVTRDGCIAIFRTSADGIVWLAVLATEENKSLADRFMEELIASGRAGLWL